MPLGIDPTLAQQQAKLEEEQNLPPVAIVPEHKRVWPTTEQTLRIVTPKAPPLKKAGAETAFMQSEQMQAEEPEHVGDLFMQWSDGRSCN